MPTVVYAAENHNQAAELLLQDLRKYVSPERLHRVQMLNTVIGKMSGIITEMDVIERLGLVTITPTVPRAVLVEEFNRIFISRVTLEGYRRGIEVFIEKDDLLPFEEAKLYGHNAIHALIAYLADRKSLRTVAEAGKDKQIMLIARDAFINESGAALIKRHAKLSDPLFTPDGYRHYAEDLLERMICPNLNDLVSRVGRDHVRKLGYEDRLYGTMRIALQYGVEPRNLALGAAAGVLSMIKRQDSLSSPVADLPNDPSELSQKCLKQLLLGMWRDEADEHAETLISMTWEALGELSNP
jgi:mannitol-1-phosphate/altronate dehydrogenase